MQLMATGTRLGPSTRDGDPAVRFGLSTVLGRDVALLRGVLEARAAAKLRTPVLLSGPTGTGKELFARGIHYEGVTRDEPFIVVNCGALPAALLGSELFGFEGNVLSGSQSPRRGLIELAGAGTLFLDEIGELPAELQTMLLRLVEDRSMRRLGGTHEIPAPCRVIAASNAPLEAAVDRGTFREDLFYRLNSLCIHLPPLRERGQDTLLLAEAFLAQIAEETGSRRPALSEDAVSAMLKHAWPGNVRELRNVLHRACMMVDGPVITARDLTIQRRSSVAASDADLAGEIRVPRTGRTLVDIEREAVRITVAAAGGNHSNAARMLGISRTTLIRKLKELDCEHAA